MSNKNTWRSCFVYIPLWPEQKMMTTCFKFNVYFVVETFLLCRWRRELIIWYPRILFPMWKMTNIDFIEDLKNSSHILLFRDCHLYFFLSLESFLFILFISKIDLFLLLHGIYLWFVFSMNKTTIHVYCLLAQSTCVVKKINCTTRSHLNLRVEEKSVWVFLLTQGFDILKWLYKSISQCRHHTNRKLRVSYVA
jgi:hypothetical protein